MIQNTCLHYLEHAPSPSHHQGRILHPRLPRHPLHSENEPAGRHTTDKGRGAMAVRCMGTQITESIHAEGFRIERPLLQVGVCLR